MDLRFRGHFTPGTGRRMRIQVPPAGKTRGAIPSRAHEGSVPASATPLAHVADATHSARQPQSSANVRVCLRDSCRVTPAARNPPNLVTHYHQWARRFRSSRSGASNGPTKGLSLLVKKLKRGRPQERLNAKCQFGGPRGDGPVRHLCSATRSRLLLDGIQDALTRFGRTHDFGIALPGWVNVIGTLFESPS